MNRGLIVSCQALEEEPLHSSFIMGRMALAAKQAGAIGIRANSVEDITEIKRLVDLPIIGIIKQNYPNMIPYITPTYKELDALYELNIDVIALDATIDQDEKFLKSLKQKYPNQKFMADISTVEEGLRAESLGIDYIGTTLIGYTEQSKNSIRLEVLSALISKCKNPVIAEGHFDTPKEAAKAFELGAYSVVVGSAITRPQLIAKQFVDAVNEVKDRMK